MNDKKDNKSLKVIGAAVAVILLMASLGAVLYSGGQEQPEERTNEDLAKALTEGGWVLYTTATCPVCVTQKEIFGDAVNELAIVECDASQQNYDMCLLLNISAVPTWINEGTRTFTEGLQSLEQLSEVVDLAEMMEAEE